MNLVSHEQPAQIAKIWRQLERVARPPYVLSWGWIETWLATQPSAPPLHVLERDGAPVAAAFDELPVLRTPAFPALGIATDEIRVAVERERCVPHVDLETVRAVEGGYLSTRPAVLRAALRHAQQQLGELEVEAVSDRRRAHAVFDELVALDGLPESPFLRSLVDRRAPHGEIQLLRLTRGAALAACLYSVVLHDHIACPRAAFAPNVNPDLCHAAAIAHAAARGLAFYELHPDDARLATGEARHLVLRLERHATRRLAG